MEYVEVALRFLDSGADGKVDAQSGRVGGCILRRSVSECHFVCAATG